jgi:hypothetical protein
MLTLPILALTCPINLYGMKSWMLNDGGVKVMIPCI